MNKIKLALVSYINTIPFIEGIRASLPLLEKLELITDYPAKCAEMIRHHKVDGGLIPIAALAEIDGYEIISDYCIGADGVVETVALFSQQPLEEVDTIYLDYQSRTSAQLVQILAKNYWKRKFKFLPTTQGFEGSIPDHSAVLIIGDRVFEYEHLYAYKLDLAENWKFNTNLPFAFAVWVGNDKVKAIEKELNAAFELGLNDLAKHYNDLLTIDEDHFINYLSEKIDFRLDNRKKKAIQLFTSMLN